jgi:octaprenyl-diphosphate synthase
MTEDPLSTLAPLAGRVNDTMKGILSEDGNVLGEVSLYNFMGGGKRLRPLIFCLAHAALGGEIDEEILRLSTTFEFLHMASLMHDDIVDQADTRRGRPAAHLVYGIPETVMAADYLLAKASALALTRRNVDVALVMSEVIKSLSLGELWELKAKNDVALAEAEYENIILHKTAILIEGVPWAAAILAGAPEAQASALRDYGRWTGMAFQITDDVLDYRAKPGELGKPVGQDLGEGRITLPFILAREALSGNDLDRLLALGALASPSPGEKAEAIGLVEMAGGLDRALERAKGMAGTAAAALGILPESPERDALERLARYAVSRGR